MCGEACLPCAVRLRCNQFNNRALPESLAHPWLPLNVSGKYFLYTPPAHKPFTVPHARLEQDVFGEELFQKRDVIIESLLRPVIERGDAIMAGEVLEVFVEENPITSIHQRGG
jgi:hypothetical protein